MKMLRKFAAMLLVAALLAVTFALPAFAVNVKIEGNTHLLTFKGQLKSPRDEVTIELRNDFPEWVSQCSANSDTDTGSANFASTTLGLEQWLQGMQAAFGQQGIYTTMTIKLQR